MEEDLYGVYSQELFTNSEKLNSNCENYLWKNYISYDFRCIENVYLNKKEKKLHYI